jgi:hypothetical protein
MISAFSMGTAALPTSMPNEAVDVVISLQSPMPSAKYDVLILRAASIPLSDIKVTKQTATEVTVTITRPNGHSGSGSIHVICVERAGKPATVPPKGS